MADLKTWLGCSEGRPTKRRKGQDDDDGGGGSGDDDDLGRAIKASKLEARVAEMDEETMLREAIRLSEAAVAVPGRPMGEGWTSEDNKPSPKKKVDPFQTSQLSDHADASLLLEWPDSSFSSKPAETINKLEGSLDLLYFKRWINAHARQHLRSWLLSNLAWHRVSYTRPSTKQRIVTPRFTATFGRDETGAEMTRYPVKPKEIPQVLGTLMEKVEEQTSARYNALIINYYADGTDSISYHSDDESFLGPLPTIASLSLGSSRDFYLRRKAPADVEIPPASTKSFSMGTKGHGPAASRPTEKMTLSDGDLVVMRGRTQNEWEHSIPKRANAGGRINITFRRVMTVAGTNNFQRYNRGLPSDDDTKVYRWDSRQGRMISGSGGL